MVVSKVTIGKVFTAEEAAAEKANAGENRAVEHIAELAPSQAVRAGHAGTLQTLKIPTNPNPKNPYPSINILKHPNPKNP
jgi:hypothetical protein